MVACPQCTSTRLALSHQRGWIERRLSLVGRHPFRCLSCERRFFAFATAQDRAGVRERRVLSLANASLVRLARGL